MPLNFGRKKKGAKKSKKGFDINQPYFGMIVPGSFDKNEASVSQLISEIDGFDQRWPSATLNDLEQFTKGLQELAGLTNTPYVLDSVKYMRTNYEGKPVFTGLVWDDVTIGPEFSNFVVETLETTLNDEETRDDDDVDYELTILPAFTEFMEAAVDLSNLSEAEMPVLPTVEEYERAVSTNSQIALEPKKFTNFKDAASTKSGTSNTAKVEPSFGFGLGVSDTPKSVSEQHDEKPKEITPPSMASVLEAPQVDSRKPKTVNPKSKDKRLPVTNTFVHNIQISAPLFNVSESKKPVLNPADPEYIPTKLNEDRHVANNFLATAAKELEDKIKSSILNNAFIREQQQLLDQESNNLLQSDWTSEIYSGIEFGINGKFDNFVAEAEAQAQSVLDIAIDEENKRHEARLAALQSEHEQRLTETKRSIEVDRSKEITLAKDAALPSIQAKIDTQLNSIQTRFDKSVQRYTEEKSYEMSSEANALLNNLYADFEQELRDEEDKLIPIHQDAVQAELTLRKADTSIDTADQLQISNAKLLKAQQDAETKASKAQVQLESASLQVNELKQKLDDSVAEINHMQGELDSLRHASQGDQTNSLIAAALVQKQDPTHVAPKTNNGLKWYAISIAAVAIIAGGGMFAYTQSARQSEWNKAMEKTQTDLVSELKEQKQKTESEEKRADDLEKKQSKEESTKDASGVEQVQTSSKVEQSKPVSKPFEDLDADLAIGSLGVYFSKYFGQNLETEERTLKVGSLLIQQNQAATAREVARVNTGHNWQLTQLLAGV